MKVYTPNLQKTSFTKFLFFTVLCFMVSFGTVAQNIPASNNTPSNPEANCFDCVPVGWGEPGPGTPDISDVNNAAAAGTWDGGAAWTNAPLPPPPNGHEHWITLRDIGTAATEENVFTDMTNLVIGDSYRVTVYHFSALSLYSRVYIDRFEYQVGTQGRNFITPTPALRDLEWETTTIDFVATATTERLTFYPGTNGGGSQTTTEGINLSVTLNAIQNITDSDGDGVPDTADTCVGYDDSADNDNDTIPDGCDLDDDNDGILDADECDAPVVLRYNYDQAASDNTKLVYSATYNSELYTIEIEESTIARHFTGPDGAQDPSGVSFTSGQNPPLIENFDRADDESAIKFTSSAPISRIQFSNLDDIDRSNNDAAYPTDALCFNLPGTWQIIAEDLAAYDLITGNLVVNNPNNNAAPNISTGNSSADEFIVRGGVSDVLTRGIADGTSANQTQTDNGVAIFIADRPFNEISLLFEDLSDGGDRESIRSLISTSFLDIAVIVCPDSDGDGMTDNLDLDSDGDGCPDALEGDGGLDYSNLNPDGSINIATNPVNDNGIPVGPGTAGNGTTGQNDVSSTNAAVQSAICNPCSSGHPEYVDSDGDTIGDVCDLDDDNDGILDADENGTCGTTGSVVSTVFSEDFGTQSTANGTLSTISPYTNYAYYSAEVGNTPTDNADGNSAPQSLQDGRYTIFNNISETAAWASSIWQTIGDHTNGGASPSTGKMAIFNGTNTAGLEFYKRELVNIVPGAPVSVSFWLMNIDTNIGGNDGRNLPNITVNFVQGGSTIYTFNTGDVPRFAAGDVNAWQQFSSPTPFIPTSGDPIEIVFINNAPGGGGNDLALDDILVTQTLCDTDGDTTPDHLDNDSDDDGCFDALEGDQNYTLNDVNGSGMLTGGVDVNGVPTVTNGGQNDVSSTDDTVFSDECDNDNDGNINGTDPFPNTPTAQDENSTATLGVATAINILDNDDFLTNLDANNIGTTELSDTGNGTATGVIQFDENTGNLIYTSGALETIGDVVTVIYQVCNTDPDPSICDIATVNITITAANSDPIAVDDTYNINEDEDVTLTPLDDDSDPDGDTLVIESINGTALTPGTPQTIAVTNGTVTVDAAGVITFTPDENFNGSVVIPYVITDGTATATANENITVDPINDAPVAVDDDYTVDEDDSVVLTPLDLDTDLDGDTLTIQSIGGTALTPGTPQ
ncbi:Ig-like domain-containing protein, partial [Cochleicola gelatinilyticus]|uniref:Ig-like domain-containing protein n=1 Tax=Cochleicola gelatinilyticus TaxID=1763537 RepID=UPI000AF9E46C